MSNSSEKLEHGSWSEIDEAPVSDGFSDYSVVFYSGNFYYFGGWTGGLRNFILGLNAATWSWSKVGHLTSTRAAHGVILIENTFMVIGGGGFGGSGHEACLLRNERIECSSPQTSTRSEIIGYYTPVLFLVSEDFGLC